MKRSLSTQQANVYKRVQRVLEQQGALPPLSDLAKALGLHYTTLRQHLQALDAKGWVRFESRGTGRPPRLELIAQPLGIPVVGDIPAGPLSEAIEGPDGYLGLPMQTGLFGLTVHGESMADLIQHGDLVLLQKGAVPRPGEVCAVRVGEGDVTLKYLDWSEAAPQTRILRPHNPLFPTLTAEAESLHVEGVYRGLLRGSVIGALLQDAPS